MYSAEGINMHLRNSNAYQYHTKVPADFDDSRPFPVQPFQAIIQSSVSCDLELVIPYVWSSVGHSPSDYWNFSFSSQISISPVMLFK